MNIKTFVLAYELSAKHHKRSGDHDKAKKLFQEAEACYVKWGCPKKTDEMKEAVKNNKIVL